MPILGGTGSLEIVERGIFVPKGSLNTWKAARDAHASQLVEVPILGDSTTFGIGGEPLPGNYSFTQRMRNRFVAAGLTDGGVGYLATLGALGGGTGGTLGAQSVEPDGPYATNSGFAEQSDATAAIYNMAFSVTGGDTLTFTVPATYRAGAVGRLWWVRSTQDAGTFTYAINGGTPVLVEADYGTSPIEPTALTGFWSPSFVWLSGLAPRDTITVRNVGGVQERPPVFYQGQSQGVYDDGAGNLAAGSYFYKVTKVAGGGETTPSSSVTLTIGANRQISLRISDSATGPYGGTYNIYRSTTVGGTYLLVGSTTATVSPGGFALYTDNVASPGTQQPPTVSTAGINALRKNVRIGLDLMNSTGIVVHNHGISGAILESFFDVTDTQNNIKSVAIMGLARKQGVSYAGSEYLGQSTTPHDRRPPLVALKMGANDVAHTITIGDFGSKAAAIELFIEMCRNAGADPLLLIPTAVGVTNNGGNRANMGWYRAAVFSVAMSHGVAVIDLQEAVGPLSQASTYAGSNNSVHLSRAGYDKEGDAIANLLLRV